MKNEIDLPEYFNLSYEAEFISVETNEGLLENFITREIPNCKIYRKTNNGGTLIGFTDKDGITWTCWFGMGILRVIDKNKVEIYTNGRQGVNFKFTKDKFLNK